MFRIPDETKTIRAQLLTAMKEGEYANCDRLPRESVLSELLGISRTQLRDILASLEREGFITRRHGVGTIINRHVLDIPARMDIEMEFMDMIRASGHTPDVAFARVEEGHASSHEAEMLQIPEGTPVLRFIRLYHNLIAGFILLLIVQTCLLQPFISCQHFAAFIYYTYF